MTTDRRTFLGTLGVLGVACTRPIVARPAVPRGRLVAPDDFAFAPDLAYLQTGSLGPSPRQVVERAFAVWKQLEADPSVNGYGVLQKGMEVVRGKAAALLGCKLDELVLTNCTTEGMNWVAQGLSLAAGDRILTTDQEHPGGRVGWDFVAKRYGATIDVVAIPPGENDAGAIVERFARAITPRTVAFSFSHVLSSTGLRMPVAELSALARKANAIAIVDGAQAAGAIPIDVKALGCHVYATSGHKWLLGPPGTGMLYLSDELGDRVEVIALQDGRAAYTHSSGVCSIPSVHGLGAAIDYMTGIEIERVLAYNLELHRHAHERLSALPKLRIVSADYLLSSDGLATGEIDAAFGVAGMPLRAGQQSRPLYEEIGTLVVRRDHPRIRDRLTPKLFNSAQHIDVQLALGRAGTGHQIAEQKWRALGLQREVVLAVPHFVAAALAAARSDYVAALPRRVAMTLASMLPLRITRPTFDMPRVAVTLVWHARTDADAGARYFRELIARAVSAPRYPASRRSA